MTKDELRTQLKQMPTGWYEAFGEPFLDELWNALVEYDCTDKFFIEQVKEKWGWLRIYFNDDLPEIIYSIHDKYELISAHTCIRCGRPDVGRLQVGKILPMCKKCFDKECDGTYSLVVPTGIMEVRIPDYYIRTWRKGHKEIDVTYNISTTVNKVRENWRRNHPND